MKKYTFFSLTLFIIVAIMFSSCQKENLEKPTIIKQLESLESQEYDTNDQLSLEKVVIDDDCLRCGQVVSGEWTGLGQHHYEDVCINFPQCVVKGGRLVTIHFDDEGGSPNMFLINHPDVPYNGYVGYDDYSACDNITNFVAPWHDNGMVDPGPFSFSFVPKHNAYTIKVSTVACMDITDTWSISLDCEDCRVGTGDIPPTDEDGNNDGGN